jgi:hypothetical protein
MLYGEFGLVNVISLIPSQRYRPRKREFVKAVYRNRHVLFERRAEASVQAPPDPTMSASRSSVIEDCTRTKVLILRGAAKPAKGV